MSAEEFYFQPIFVHRGKLQASEVSSENLCLVFPSSFFPFAFFVILPVTGFALLMRQAVSDVSLALGVVFTHLAFVLSLAGDVGGVGSHESKPLLSDKK